MIPDDGMGEGKRWSAILQIGVLLPLSVYAAALPIGCGAPAAPQPPTLNLPEPVRSLQAVRVEDRVEASFAVPEKTTDKLPIRGLMSARLCRAVEQGPCLPVATLGLAADQKGARIGDKLPRELTSGAPRLLVYRVAVLNQAAKTAGDSTPAFVAAGAAPPAIAGFTAVPRRTGIILSWQPADLSSGTAAWVRFDRTRTTPAGASAGRQNSLPGERTVEEPAEQSLQVVETGSRHPGFAVDRTAHPGESYRYVAQRVFQVTVEHHSLEIAGPPTSSLTVQYRDIFPPPVPTGLVSAVDTASHAVDLSWNPETDPGLAGYVVYRRNVASQESPERISPAGAPVPAPAWRDSTAVPGTRYAYSVSAVDTSGNESARSTEIEEGLAPNQP